MALQNKLVATITAVGNHDILIPGARYKTIHAVYSGAVGTIQIYGTLSKTAADFVQIGADITTDTLRDDTTLVEWLRIRCSAYTSGTITVRIMYETRP